MIFCGEVFGATSGMRFHGSDRVRAHIVLLCAFVSACAATESCATPRSKLMRLDCKQDLHDSVIELPLGSVDASHPFKQPVSSLRLAAKSPRVARFARSSTPGRRSAPSQLPPYTVGGSELDSASICPLQPLPPSATAGWESFDASPRRRLFSSPTAQPTALPSPAPSGVPNPNPIPSPTVTAVPTTTETTTFAQLRNAVADPTVSTIFVPVTIKFTVQIEVTRNLSIVGMDGDDVALRNADAPLERLFYVHDGGALRLESLHLLNNATTLSETICAPYDVCCGPVIYAYYGHVELAGCTIRDTVGSHGGNAMFLETSTAVVTNCTFTRLRAAYGTAFFVYLSSTLTVASSVFHENDASQIMILFSCESVSSLAQPHTHLPHFVQTGTVFSRSATQHSRPTRRGLRFSMLLGPRH